MPGSNPPTPILGLNQYLGGDAWNFNDVDADNQKIDRVPPTFCTFATRPATNLFVGRLIYETDTKNFMMWDGAAWVWLSTTEKLPAPVRGYFITATKAVTATAWADVASDTAKSITVPAGKSCMAIIAWRAELLTTNAATNIAARLAYTGGTTGNSYDQMDSGILGANVSLDTAQNRQQYTMSLLLGPGVTTFKLQAQRGNTTNATSVSFAGISITPLAWSDQIAAGAT